MPSVAHFPIQRRQMATDDDVMMLLEGPMVAMREQARWLIKILANNKNIDRDLWDGLARYARVVLDESEQLLCVRCLSRQDVTLGRGNGFDAILCDSCVFDLAETRGIQ